MSSVEHKRKNRLNFISSLKSTPEKRRVTLLTNLFSCKEEKHNFIVVVTERTYFSKIKQELKKPISLLLDIK